ncbi:MAG TPA: FGGY family carbohydrate kinase [Actinocrinis sp.]|nr:FGGY family carbohydrate kinase [Actinocrinis sp.]
MGIGTGMMATVMAIDQDGAGVKALIVGSTGKLLAKAGTLLRVHRPGEGVAEVDPEDLWHGVLDVAGKAMAQAGRPIDAVAVTCDGQSVLRLDRATGRALSAIVLGQDRRADALRPDLHAHREQIEHVTGTGLDPSRSAWRMAWLTRHHPGEGVVATVDAWLAVRLTGRFVTDAATAGRSQLAALDTGCWDPGLAGAFGLDNGNLPEIVACDEIIGTTDAFGTGPVPVAALLSRHGAALLAHHCLAVGQAACTYGSGALLAAQIGDTPARSGAGLDTSIAWRLGGVSAYAGEGQLPAAGSALTWLVRAGLLHRAADLDDAALPDPGLLVAVPALAGLGAPWHRPDATGLLAGWTQETRPAHLVSAVVYGIAAMVAELADLASFEAAVPLTELRAGGALSRTGALMQAQADLLQIPVTARHGAHEAALGAVAAARLALDDTLTVQDALVAGRGATVYRPRWSPTRAAQYRSSWRASLHGGLDTAPDPPPAGGPACTPDHGRAHATEPPSANSTPHTAP